MRSWTVPLGGMTGALNTRVAVFILDHSRVLIIAMSCWIPSLPQCPSGNYFFAFNQTGPRTRMCNVLSAITGRVMVLVYLCLDFCGNYVALRTNSKVGRRLSLHTLGTRLIKTRLNCKLLSLSSSPILKAPGLMLGIFDF